VLGVVPDVGCADECWEYTLNLRGITLRVDFVRSCAANKMISERSLMLDVLQKLVSDHI
jgi:hypothetical protein